MSKEIWERDPCSLPITKEVIAHKRKRLTKGQLVQIHQKGGDRMSPKLDTEVREGADDVVEGVAYEIVNIEDVETEVQNLQGIRVSLLSQKAQEGNVMLWKRKVTGTGSKLGVFITELGNNTDSWLHKWVIFETWQPRNRKLVVVPTPKGKPIRAKKS